jgi:hypothetical protein
MRRSDRLPLKATPALQVLATPARAPEAALTRVLAAGFILAPEVAPTRAPEGLATLALVAGVMTNGIALPRIVSD